jgi:hypothetical protein
MRKGAECSEGAWTGEVGQTRQKAAPTTALPSLAASGRGTSSWGECDTQRPQLRCPVRLRVRKHALSAMARGALLVAALCLRAASVVDRAEALAVLDGKGHASPPRKLKSFNEEDGKGGGKPPNRLQRSRSESALAMLERKNSQDSIQDPKQRL